MLDFLQVAPEFTRNGGVKVVPTFVVTKSKDLMIRGGDFYAIWDDENKSWTTDPFEAIRLIDICLREEAEAHPEKYGPSPSIQYLRNSSSGSIDKWNKFCQKQMPDSYHALDEKLIFANDKLSRRDYSSHRLGYALEEGPTEAWDEIMSTLYEESEREKIEWAIGAIVSGDSKKIQKFLVLYGAAGTGKSTVLNIVQNLFDGYYSVFDARALGSSSNAFALEAFKTNPLVAIQHDGDLSHIEDNTRLNSLISHEKMTVNEKFKSTYSTSFNSFLFLGTNKPVKITDAKSGLIRRLIDVTPTGNKIPRRKYDELIEKVGFELGHIASKCLEFYKENPKRYENYIPLMMMGATNDFYDYMVSSYPVFKRQDGTTLKAAWEMYKVYCEDANVSYPYSQRVFREELKNYFWKFDERAEVDGARIRSWYSRFRTDRFESMIEEGKSKKVEKKVKPEPIDIPDWLKFTEHSTSVLDQFLHDIPAQLGNDEGKPLRKWKNVKTNLSDIDPTDLHYVNAPIELICIDFDIKDDKGEKCFEKNAAAASKWPRTYAELSKSGGGIHLYYIYSGGDPKMLSRVYDEHIEIKVFTGDGSLRRKLTKCNDEPIATISSGLPLREEKPMAIDPNVKMTEARLVKTIIKCLNKEYDKMPSTTQNMNFIKELMDQAYNSGINYDISNMRSAIFTFASSATNQSEYCMSLIPKMHFQSEEASEPVIQAEDLPIIFYDVEVFPNLFLLNWMYDDDNASVTRMINPSPAEVEELTAKYRLIGFNNRQYDNHILYGRILGFNELELYNLSKKIIGSKKGSSDNGRFREAFNLSYTDIYDFAAKKQSLKKWEIELKIHHQELGLPWDEPVPEELWTKVAEYCDNDVISTRVLFHHLKGDFDARLILAKMAGGTPNDTTNSLTTRLIFGRERKPRLNYVHLEETFPGYQYVEERDENGRLKARHNMYRDEDMGFGGYIRSWANMYSNVALLDVASLHPTSLILMNYFGEYTERYAKLKEARVLIKHGDLEGAKKLFNGEYDELLNDPSQSSNIAQALKIALNSTYGLTSAKFENSMRHPDNVNNIVALRGALFMKTLRDEVESRGYSIVAIKTDSIKIANADKDIVDFCIEFAKSYGYTFEFEAAYQKICQINDADYIAQYMTLETCEKIFGVVPGDNKDAFDPEIWPDHPHIWTATGKQFKVPYVFKTLFSKEDLDFDDFCEVKESKTGPICIDMNESLPDVSAEEKELDKLKKQIKDGKVTDENYISSAIGSLTEDISKGHDYQFVGRVGQFTPVKSGCGGGILVVDRDGKHDAVAGTKGYRWLESELLRNSGRDNDIDRSYYDSLVNDAVENMSQYGDVEWFLAVE